MTTARISSLILRTIVSTMIVFSSAASNAQNDETAFLEGFPDIPLLNGFKVIEGSSLVFDTPAGTIAEIQLNTPSSAKSPLVAYTHLLQSMGWQCEGESSQSKCNRAENALTLKYTQSETLLALKLEPIDG